MRYTAVLLLLVCAIVPVHSAHAAFLLSSSIIEFNKDTPTNQDIELVSRSKENDYIVTEVSEIQGAGSASENRQVVEDPSQGGLLVTPDKTVLAAGSRKVLRFVLLRDLDQSEHIYRIKVQPVVKGVNAESTKVGLKILVGYEVLAIVRPIDINVSYNVARQGQKLTIVNNGNSNVLLQNGKQCPTEDHCKDAPVARVYPGEHKELLLPLDSKVSYSIWDGQQTIEKQY